VKNVKQMKWMKRGEVWWIDFDPSLGGEIQKVRPGVIMGVPIEMGQLDSVLFRIER
jgi:mRNA interferase MazF